MYSTPAGQTPLLTMTVSDTGELHVYPGEGFTDEDIDLLVNATGAVQDVLDG